MARSWTNALQQPMRGAVGCLVSNETPQAWGPVATSVPMKGWQCDLCIILRAVGLWDKVALLRSDLKPSNVETLPKP